MHVENLKFRGFTQICQLVNEGKEIPGFCKPDFNCSAFRSELLDLEAASSLLFKQFLPYLNFVETKSLHGRLAKIEAESENNILIRSIPMSISYYDQVKDL